MTKVKRRKVVRTERGWAGHFICARECLFRRNTLLEYGDFKIVVSTVGCYRRGEQIEEIGCGRYYETMAFHVDPADVRYHDADVTRQVDFDSPWSIGDKDADDRANDMHETVVDEIAVKLKKGKIPSYDETG